MVDKTLSGLTSIGTLTATDTGDATYVVHGGNSRRVHLGGVAAVLASAAIATFFNVQSAAYGAVGDGSTDDSAAIQAALDAAAASAFVKAVYLPHTSGGYAIGATLTIDEGVTVFGDNMWGQERSRIKPTSGFTSPLLRTEDYGVTRKLRVGIRGLFFDGSSTTLTAVQLNIQESLFQDNTVKNCFTYGLHFGGVGSGATSQALNNHIIDNYFAGTIATTEFFDGIFIDYYSADNTIERNYIEASKDAGIRSRGYNNKITNNHIYSVAGTGGGVGAGIYTETSADHDISQNYIELTAAEGILMAGGGSDVATLAAVIHGNVFRNIDTGNTSNGVIEIANSDVSAVSISGNVVRRDAATSYATPYFVYFNGITPTLANVYGNVGQSGLITTSETNLSNFPSGLSVGNVTALSYGINSVAPVLIAGAAAAVATTTAATEWLWGESAARTALTAEAAIWAGKIHNGVGIAKIFTSAHNQAVANTGPANALFVYARNNACNADVVALLADAHAVTANQTVFGANIIARNDVVNGVKIVGCEIDVEFAATTTAGAGSGGLYINVFNVAVPGPAIQIGALSGGTFNNGLVIAGLASTNSAGVCPNSTAAMGSLINSGAGVYNDAAIVLSNTHRTRYNGTASAHAAIYNDAANALRIVGGSVASVFRNNADTASLWTVSDDGTIVHLAPTGRPLTIQGLNSAIQAEKYVADANPNAYLAFKSRNATFGSHTILQSGDAVGRFEARGSDGAGFISLGYIEWTVDGTPGTNDMPGRAAIFTTPDGSATALERLRVSSTGAVTALAPLGGLGYGTGAGGAVTQATSRTTGVTLNTVCGAITLVSAAGSATFASFTVTNSAVVATDTVVAVQKSGTDLYEIHVTAVAAGSFRITFRTTGGTTTEQPVFNFAVIKAVAA